MIAESFNTECFASQEQQGIEILRAINQFRQVKEVCFYLGTDEALRDRSPPPN